MNNISQCPRCGRSFIGEEAALHKCVGKIVDIRYKWAVKTDIDGVGKVLFIEGTDGTLYRLLPSFLAKRKFTGDEPNDDWTKP